MEECIPYIFNEYGTRSIFGKNFLKEKEKKDEEKIGWSITYSSNGRNNVIGKCVCRRFHYGTG